MKKFIFATGSPGKFTTAFQTSVNEVLWNDDAVHDILGINSLMGSVS